MSNLESAKVAIEEEIQHAKAGLAYYSTRVEKLQDFLRRLGAISNTSHPIKRSSQQRERVTETHAAPAKQDMRTKPGNRLPRTGREFWLALLDDGSQLSNSELLESAINAIGLKLSKKERLALYNRMSVAFTAFVRDGVVKDIGSGKERKFYKP